MAVKRSERFSSGTRGGVANVDPVVARHLVAELRRCGVDPALVLNGLGFTLEDLAHPSFRLTYAQTSQLIRRSVRLLHDPHLGLRLGSGVNFASWGVFYVGMMACADSRQWLDFVAEFLPSAAGLLRLRCEETPQGPSLVAAGLDDDPEVVTFLVEKLFAALAHAYRLTVSAKHGPTLVDLAIPPPTSSSLFTSTLGCVVRFARAENRMLFPQALIPLQSADFVTAQRVRHVMSEQATAASTAHELETCIIRALAGRLANPPSLPEIARTLHMSERTLRRRLSDLGLSYAAILDRERRDRALALIRSGKHALASIATQAGFADTRSLRRAVRRWTTHSPTELRRPIAPRSDDKH